MCPADNEPDPEERFNSNPYASSIPTSIDGWTDVFPSPENGPKTPDDLDDGAEIFYMSPHRSTNATPPKLGLPPRSQLRSSPMLPRIKPPPKFNLDGSVLKSKQETTERKSSASLPANSTYTQSDDRPVSTAPKAGERARGAQTFGESTAMGGDSADDNIDGINGIAEALGRATIDGRRTGYGGQREKKKKTQALSSRGVNRKIIGNEKGLRKSSGSDFTNRAAIYAEELRDHHKAGAGRARTAATGRQSSKETETENDADDEAGARQKWAARLYGKKTRTENST